MSDLISAALGPIAAALLSNVGPRRTKPAQTPAGLYALALRAPTAPYVPLAIYTFPLGPSQIRRGVMGMGNFYDMGGNPANFGVNRVPDIYGQSPPIYTIIGTTGVKYHSGDNYLYTGLESIEILFSIIAQYYSLNAAQAQAGQNNLYTLEFYDYYMGQFWQVVPLGDQSMSQNNLKPQLIYYSLRLVGIASLEQPIGALLDPILSLISNGASSLFSSAQSSFSSVTSNYSSYNIGAGP